jgi:hypothetical protein
MATGATGQLGLALPVQGELSGTWGDTVNNGITQYTNIAIAGTLTLTGDGAVTLANTTGDASASNITSTLAGAGTVTAQFSAVRVSGTTTTKVVTGPSYSKTYLLDNASSYAVTFKASGQTGVSISPGEKVYVYYNATDYVKVGGGGITYGAVKTTTYTAVANDGVQTNTTSGAFTVNLPASPATGTQVFVVDSFGTWGTNNLTIGRNGSTIEGSATDLVCDINGVSIQCIYNGTTWDIYAQVGANDTAVVTLNGTQTLTNKTLTAPILTAPVLGTPASGTVTNLTGTASININGTVGATTPAAGTFTTVTGSNDASLNGLTVGRGASAVLQNTAVGTSALAANTSGANNTAVGYLALQTVTTGPRNTAIGRNALNLVLSGSDNTAVGHASLENNTGGDNTAVGTASMQTNTSGQFNVAIGRSALQSNTTASNNTAVGYQAGYSNTTGSSNVAVGTNALQSATTTINSTAVGYQASYSTVTGSRNTAIGTQALYSATGTLNTAIGDGAGYYISTGNRNSIIGRFDGNQGGLDIRTASNYIVLSDGDGNPRAFYVPSTGTWALTIANGTGGYTIKDDGFGNLKRETSSARYKDNIRDSAYGLNAVMQLQSRMYETKFGGQTDVGLIAEEVALVIPELTIFNKEQQPDSVSYDKITSVLIKAIQELKAEFDAYKAGHP